MAVGDGAKIGGARRRLRERVPFFAILWLALAAFFGYIWYERYLRIDFNELGRYWDSEAEMVYTEGGFVWAIPTAIFLICGIRAAIRHRNAAKRRNSRAT